MSLRKFLVLSVLGFGVALATASAADEPTPRAARRDYELQPGDVIRVQVFQEPDLEREIRVSQEGEVSLPLIGKIAVKNRTLAQVEQNVRELYDRDYLVNPQVTVIVLKYQVRTVNVLGMVNQPQPVEYPPEQDLTLLDAISRAGGFNRLADRRRVRLTRTHPDGRMENFVINTDELVSGTSTKAWVLLRDDVIFVPEIRI